MHLLKLDPKQVRKGEALGLPWLGGKKKVAKQIAAVYNDASPAAVDMLRAVLFSGEDLDWAKALPLDRETFMLAAGKEDRTVEEEFQVLVNSFANNRTTYAMRADLAAWQVPLARTLLQKYPLPIPYRHAPEYKVRGTSAPMSTIDRINRLAKNALAADWAGEYDLDLRNQSYGEFSHVEGSILYLDPPYEIGQIKKAYVGTTFDPVAFRDWAAGMAQDNIVLISEYTMTDDRFVPVFRFENARPTASGGTIKDGRCETLYMVRGGWMPPEGVV